MTTTEEALRAGGLGLVPELIVAADWEGLALPVAATAIQCESWGRNVWGHDGVSTAGLYVKGGPVTQANYLAYRAAMKAGRIGRQGCGPAQCTSAEFQDRADELGGCWDPVANMRSGFRGLKQRIDRYGLRDGFRRYNGAGPNAETYAVKAIAAYQVWQARLTGATAAGITTQAAAPPPEEDDDEMHVPIKVTDDGRFAESFAAEAGGGGWFSRGIVTFGSAWGWTDVFVTALSARGEVKSLLGSREGGPFRVANNTSVAIELPDGCRHVTVEGAVEHPPTQSQDLGTRPWTAWIGQRA